MKALPASLLILLLCCAPLGAAELGTSSPGTSGGGTTGLEVPGLGTPSLSPPVNFTRFFDADRLLTTAGIKYSNEEQLTLEPEWGVGYHASEREFAGGIEDSIHQLHAQAGGRLSLSDTLYLSAAAKLPLLTIQSAASRYTSQDLGSKPAYDVTRAIRSTPLWTGELGIHLSNWTDLRLYYDENPAAGWLPGGPQQEERFGTRLILRFW